MELPTVLRHFRRNDVIASYRIGNYSLTSSLQFRRLDAVEFEALNLFILLETMSGRLIAIGDIHGCSTALDALLTMISLTGDDTVVALGDYVDRGPNTKGVIDRLLEVQQECKLIALQGNHEEMMLDVVLRNQPHHRWCQYGGVDTLESYQFIGDLNCIPESHHEFFANMVDFYESENHLFLHANYQPHLPLEELDVYTLRWQKLSELTPGPHFSGKRAVVGHTHDRGGEIFDVGHLVCLDTYCYGGGWLTAMDMHSGHVWQSSEDGRTRDFPAAT